MAFSPATAPDLDLRALIEANGARAAALQLINYHPVEIAELLEGLDSDDRFEVFHALPVQLAAQVLLHVDSEFRLSMLDSLPVPSLSRIFARLPAEPGAGLVEQLSRERQEEVLAAMAPEDAARLRAVRASPRGSVARLLVRLVPRVSPEMTAGESLRYLRDASDDFETVNNVYVVNEAGILVGVLALRELVEASPSVPNRLLMRTRLVTVTPDTDREKAANLLSRYNFLALPVIDSGGRLLGIVTVDDLVDVLIKEGTEDLLHLGGVSGGDDVETETTYWTGRITSTVKKRIGWLLLLFVTGSLTSTVLGRFQYELKSVIALSFFVPLLIGTGGNAGSQTVMTVVRGLALGEIRPADAGRVVLREMATGLLLGLMLGMIAFVGGWIWTEDIRLGQVLGAAVVCVCVWSTCVGSLIPISAQVFKIDPTVASAPFISTIVDATGLLIYLYIARLILQI